ncbi:hypothetical protein STRIP9103_00728, partial [Streptomyces ipomoeae 91-03]
MSPRRIEPPRTTSAPPVAGLTLPPSTGNQVRPPEPRTAGASA